MTAPRLCDATVLHGKFRAWAARLRYQRQPPHHRSVCHVVRMLCVCWAAVFQALKVLEQFQVIHSCLNSCVLTLSICCCCATCFMQAIGSFKEKPNYKQLEALIQSAREAKLEIFRIARKASSLDREAVSATNGMCLVGPTACSWLCLHLAQLAVDPTACRQPAACTCPSLSDHHGLWLRPPCQDTLSGNSKPPLSLQARGCWPLRISVMIPPFLK